MAFECQDVVDKFLERFAVESDAAEQLFLDTKMWLWLNVKAWQEGYKGLAINADLEVLDEMWHTFILFTKEYTQFCVSCFGAYLHHKPTTVREKALHQQGYAADTAQFKSQLHQRNEAQYEFIYDHLGSAVLERWHLLYPEQFPPLALETLRYKP